MTHRVALAALLAALLALLPVLYFHAIWPTVQALVPTHHSGGQPNQFVGRELLWNIVWLPAVAFAVLTFLPQVRDGESLFWSSPRQRRARLLVVAGLAVAVTTFIRSAAQDSRQPLGLPAARPALAPPAR